MILILLFSLLTPKDSVPEIALNKSHRNFYAIENAVFLMKKCEQYKIHDGAYLRVQYLPIGKKKTVILDFGFDPEDSTDIWYYKKKPVAIAILDSVRVVFRDSVALGVFYELSEIHILRKIPLLRKKSENWTYLLYDDLYVRYVFNTKKKKFKLDYIQDCEYKR